MRFRIKIQEIGEGGDRIPLYQRESGAASLIVTVPSGVMIEIVDQEDTGKILATVNTVGGVVSVEHNHNSDL
jgi:hypothetical protein